MEPSEEAMDGERFRQELIIAALNGFTSNSFIASQFATMDALSIKKMDSIGALAEMAIKTVDAVLAKLPDSDSRIGVEIAAKPAVRDTPEDQDPTKF